jgi:predicted SAM-dependent methyltransferase
MDGWINIDVTDKSMADIVMDFKEIKNNFRSGTVNEILMVHSISYLRLWEARDFFGEVMDLLEPGGQLTMEFPDIAKCATVVADKNSSRENYIEAVRAFYAFDMDEIRDRHPYYPYHFGWSADHISEELKSAGFKTVKVLDPQTHSQRTWRDSRVEAIK